MDTWICNVCVARPGHVCASDHARRAAPACTQPRAVQHGTERAVLAFSPHLLRPSLPLLFTVFFTSAAAYFSLPPPIRKPSTPAPIPLPRRHHLSFFFLLYSSPTSLSSCHDPISPPPSPGPPLGHGSSAPPSTSSASIPLSTDVITAISLSPSLPPATSPVSFPSALIPQPPASVAERHRPRLSSMPSPFFHFRRRPPITASPPPFPLRRRDPDDLRPFPLLPLRFPPSDRRTPPTRRRPPPPLLPLSFLERRRPPSPPSSAAVTAVPFQRCRPGFPSSPS